jgi:NAD(P)H-quinone oxidoreductase subunit 5
MNIQILALVALLPPSVFVATAVVSWFQPGARPTLLKKTSIGAALASMVIAAYCAYLVITQGFLQSELIGYQDFGLSIRLDALTVTMLVMISLLSFVVIKFSSNYLDGDKRQGSFLGRLAAAIASVQLLVLSANLGLLLISWVLISISLHRLLLFYPERPGAAVAARKKFIVARIGDACLTGAILLLYQHFGTGDLETIFTQIKDTSAAGLPLVGVQLATLLLVLAALLKSAQFPTHSWLIEVMETPTPVSALLHAGLLNAGPFLIVRMSFLIEADGTAPLLLMGVGGITALFASVVFLTQTSVKTALSYSSVAHMGFSLFICGAGLYPAALLHLVAHSFYKAHAFLSSGSAIDVLRATNVALPKSKVSPMKIALGIFMAMNIYTGFAYLWGIEPAAELPLLAIGAIIIMGLSRIFVSALASPFSIPLVARACGMAIMVTAAFFTLEAGSRSLFTSQIPDLPDHGFLQIVFIGFLLLAFGGVVFVQLLVPSLSATPRYRSLAVHVRNGLYVNAAFDRIIGALRIHVPRKHTTLIQPTITQPHPKEIAPQEVYA